jgi:anti-sigma factor RsiW
MKNACEKWKDQLLEAALTGRASKDLEEHLKNCASCAADLDELGARRVRLDALLPLVAKGEEPSAGFRARVLAAAESADERKRARPWRRWTLAGAAVLVAALIVGVTLLRRNGLAVPEGNLAVAQKLAEWRAPSDGLLRTPGQEILNTTPKLGNSYLSVPMKNGEEE